MTVSSEDERRAIGERFQSLPHPVRLVVFTQAREDASCRITRRLAEEIASCAELLTVEVSDILEDGSWARELGIQRIPSLALLVGSHDPYVRFYGTLAGYQVDALLDTIEIVAVRESGLPSERRDALRAIREPTQLRILVGATYPACVNVVTASARLARTCDKLRVDVVELADHPHLAVRGDEGSLRLTTARAALERRSHALQRALLDLPNPLAGDPVSLADGLEGLGRIDHQPAPNDVALPRIQTRQQLAYALLLPAPLDALAHHLVHVPVGTHQPVREWRGAGVRAAQAVTHACHVLDRYLQRRRDGGVVDLGAELTFDGCEAASHEPRRSRLPAFHDAPVPPGVLRDEHPDPVARVGSEPHSPVRIEGPQRAQEPEAGLLHDLVVGTGHAVATSNHRAVTRLGDGTRRSVARARKPCEAFALTARISAVRDPPRA